MPKKAYKWRFKIFSRNGVFEMLYNFEFNGAPKPERPEKVDEIGYLGADVVLRLCQYLPKQSGYKIWAVGTLRKDRKRRCSLKSERKLKKEGRGTFDGCINLKSGCSIVR